MGEFIYQWLDVLWLPVAWLLVHKDHRWMTMGLIVTCILTLRTQVELMKAIGFPTGLLPVLDGPIYDRGLIGYGAVIGIFLILAHFSQSTGRMIFFTATISIYIMAFCLNMLLMVL